LLHSARTFALEYNMVPSLHVALSVCCVAIFVRRATAFGRVLLWSWAAAIALSTLLTHQHHVIDAVTGWLLGLAVSRSVPEGPAADSKLLAASEKLAKVRALR
jgi:membrane-associated phospholipid phosphatase